MKLWHQYALQFGAAAMALSIAGALVFWLRLTHSTDELIALGKVQSEISLNDQIRERADRVAALLASTVEEAVRNGDSAAVARYAGFVASQPTITAVRIHDESGRPIYDSQEPPNGPAYDPSMRDIARTDGPVHDLSETHVTVHWPIAQGGAALGVVTIDMETGWVEGVSERFAGRMLDAASNYRRDTVQFALLIVAVMTLASIAVAAYLGVRLSRPILKIREAATTHAAGERLRIDVARTDEIGDLARTLEQTFASLERTTVSRDYLDDLVNGLPDAVLVVSEGRIARLNSAAEKLFDCKACGVVGQRASELLPEALIGEAGNLDRLSTTVSIEVSARSLPVLVSAGRVGAVDSDSRVFVVRDITEIAEREKELRLASERARSADRAKSEFMATMSHELRTPLNAIIGFSELMSMEKLAPLGHPRYKEYIGDIQSSGVHLLALINDILDISKIEAGQMRLVVEDVDPWETARAAAQLVRERATSRFISLEIDLPDEDIFIPADQIKLKQILLNVLSNAVKFTSPRGRIVMSGAFVSDQWVTITVADNGIGMTPEELAIVVLPFRQAENAATRQHGGTGLGLPLAIRLTELHGGELLLESEKGKGTRVTIMLPARPGPQALRSMAAQGALSQVA